jgi:hypothetical protein
MPLRTAFAAALIALSTLAASATAAPDRAGGISPGLVHRGQQTTLTVATGTTAVPCFAMLRYADGHLQTTSSKRPSNHRVTFVVRVPANAGMGEGRWKIACGKLGVFGTFVVVGTQSTTTTDAPRVVVATQGFDQRPSAGGLGSTVSYGVMLHNTSQAEDAQNVYVIVNMVAADGSLIGSKSQTVATVPAGGNYALGDSLPLRTTVAATHLEITVRVGAHQPKEPHTMPDLANVRILPDPFDPGFVHEVDGEVVNDTSKATLSSATLSIVILDATGTPIGGGTGYLYAPVPSGSRFVFTAQNGFTAIPLDKAVTAVVSIVPHYTQT